MSINHFSIIILLLYLGTWFTFLDQKIWLQCLVVVHQFWILVGWYKIFCPDRLLSGTHILINFPPHTRSDQCLIWEVVVTDQHHIAVQEEICTILRGDVLKKIQVVVSIKIISNIVTKMLTARSNLFRVIYLFC